jgi:hypothetical protein
MRWFKRQAGRASGQSMVEFLVVLPILLIMISGLIEFGFLLNYYLDLIDGARDGARFGANVDPLLPDQTPPFLDCVNTTYYYRLVPCVVTQSLAPQVVLDPTTDDIVLSSFAVAGGVVTARFPDADGWSLTGHHVSEFTTAEINAMLDPAAPNTGLVLVEVFYDYNMVMALPWITAFVPNPVVLHAYTIMPNTYVEPTPPPSP